MTCSEQPCTCSCGKFVKGIRTSSEDDRDAGPSSEKSPLALGRGASGNVSAHPPSTGSNEHGEQVRNKEVRVNNNLSGRGALLSPTQSSPRLIEAESVATCHQTAAELFMALPTRTPTTQLGASIDQHSPPSPEKQVQMLSHWTNFAAGGVKEDDNKREELAAAEAEFAMRHQPAEISLIDFDDGNSASGEQPSNPVKSEAVVAMKNERKKWLHEYQPSNNVKPGSRYSTPLSIRSSESGHSSGQQSVVDLLD